MKITIYVEGGGEKTDSKDLKTKCRRGFREFLQKAGLTGQMPRIVACGSRVQAYKNFQIALRQATPDDLPVLLVDSESAVRQNSVWQHLANHDKWQQPQGATEEQTHLMVQCMESWFLADKECLQRYFGQGFNQNALPQNPRVEQIAKQDAFNGLKNASRNCKTQLSYHKGRHSFEILRRVNPSKVCAAAPYAKRLVDILKQKNN